jgi:hypothetical protein
MEPGHSLYDLALISTEFLSPPVLRAYNLPRLKTFFGKGAHCDLRREKMANTICAERSANRGMEQEPRNVVSNVTFLSLGTTKSPAVLSSHSLVSQYPSMRKRLGLHRKISLLEGMIQPAKVVRLSSSYSSYSCIWLSAVLEELDFFSAGLADILYFERSSSHSLTITVSANASPSQTAAIDIPNPTPSDLGDAVDESSTAGPTNQLDSDAMEAMAATTPLSSLSQGGTPVQPHGGRPDVK